MAFSKSAASPNGVSLDEEHDTAQFALGTLAEDVDGNVYRYIQMNSSGGAAIGDWILLDPDGWTGGDLLDTTNSNGKLGLPIGVAGFAITASYFAWVGVKGTFEVLVKASCAANAQVNSTATAGSVDDDASVGAEVVTNVNIVDTDGGSGGVVTAYIDFPQVGATL